MIGDRHAESPQMGGRVGRNAAFGHEGSALFMAAQNDIYARRGERIHQRVGSFALQGEDRPDPAFRQRMTSAALFPIGSDCPHGRDRIGHFAEPCDIGAAHIVDPISLPPIIGHAGMNRAHDIL